MEALAGSISPLLHSMPLYNDGQVWSRNVSTTATSSPENIPDTGSSCNYAAWARSCSTPSRSELLLQDCGAANATEGMRFPCYSSETSTACNYTPSHLVSPSYSDATQNSPPVLTGIHSLEYETSHAISSELGLMNSPSMDLKSYSDLSYQHGHHCESLSSHTRCNDYHHKVSGHSNNKHRNKVSLRSSSPVFPVKSTPLSDVDGQSRVTSPSEQCNASCCTLTSCVHLPMSPPSSFFTDHSSTSTLQSAGQPSSHFVELELPIKYASNLYELDKKILKLQAERSRILERAFHIQQNEASICDFNQYGARFSTCPEMPVQSSKVRLYLCPTGIKELDEPLCDGGNQLLRKIGGLYQDMQTAMATLTIACCKGVSKVLFLKNDVATYFTSIQGLIPKDQKLSLSKSEGIYSISLEEQVKADPTLTPNPKLMEALEIINKVLHCAQRITLSHNTIPRDLSMAKKLAEEKLDAVHSGLVQCGMSDRDRATIQVILKGNYITVTSVESLWAKYYRTASDTISEITECVHPS